MGDIIRRSLHLIRIGGEIDQIDPAHSGPKAADFWIGPFRSCKERAAWQNSFTIAVRRQRKARCTCIAKTNVGVFEAGRLKLTDPYQELPFDFGLDLAEIVREHVSATD